MHGQFGHTQTAGRLAYSAHVSARHPHVLAQLYVETRPPVIRTGKTNMDG